jgi:hypothetical protein
MVALDFELVADFCHFCKISANFCQYFQALGLALWRDAKSSDVP